MKAKWFVFLFFIFFAGSAQAAHFSFDKLNRLDQPLKNSTETNQNKSKNKLLFFWASWCLPCKEELKWVMQPEQKEALKEFDVGAVTVDDPNSLSLSKTILSEIQWDFPVYSDPSGEQFYELEQSGALPFVILIDEYSSILKVFKAFNESTIGIVRAYLEKKETDSFKTKIKNESKSALKTKKLYTLTNELNLNQSIKQHELSFTGYSAKQNNNPWENEVGQSFYRFERLKNEDEIKERSGFHLDSITFGDFSAFLMGGRLFSARRFSALNENNSVLGINGRVSGSFSDRVKWDSDFSFGRVREQLFANQIQPGIDISKSIPFTKMIGNVSSLNLESGLSLKFGVVDFIAHRNESLGFYEVKDEKRFGFEVSKDWKNFQFRSLKTNHLLEGEGSINESLKWMPLFQLRAQKIDRAPSYTFLQTLSEDIITPLTLSRKNAAALKEVIILNEIKVIFSQLHEWSPHQKDLLFASGAQISDKSSRYKAIYYFKKDNENVNDRMTKEHSVRLNGSQPITDFLELSLQETSRIKKDFDQGFFLQSSLNAVINSGLFPVKFSLGVTQTHQTGGYKNLSGFSELNLWSEEFSITHQNFILKLTNGKLPGGVYCNGGSCLTRLPMNGVFTEFQLKYDL